MAKYINDILLLNGSSKAIRDFVFGKSINALKKKKKKSITILLYVVVK